MPLEHYENPQILPKTVLEQARALASIIEELEAIAWYNERAAASEDPRLVAVLEHNRDEEIEHAVMGLEWLRRNFPGFDENMRTYLFTSAPITEIEEKNPTSQTAAPAQDASLRIGSMKTKGA
jgi:hypothetical protein